MAKQITRISMAECARDPNIADIARVEWRDESGTVHVTAMTDVASMILRSGEAFFYIDERGVRAEICVFNVYACLFIQTRGSKAGDDGLRRLSRF